MALKRPVQKKTLKQKNKVGRSKSWNSRAENESHSGPGLKTSSVKKNHVPGISVWTECSLYKTQLFWAGQVGDCYVGCLRCFCFKYMAIQTERCILITRAEGQRTSPRLLSWNNWPGKCVFAFLYFCLKGSSGYSPGLDRLSIENVQNGFKHSTMC